MFPKEILRNCMCRLVRLSFRHLLPVAFAPWSDITLSENSVSKYQTLRDMQQGAELMWRRYVS